MAYLLQLGQVSGGRHLGHQPQEPGIGTEEVETVESFYSSPLPSYFKVYLVIPAVALKWNLYNFPTSRSSRCGHQAHWGETCRLPHHLPTAARMAPSRSHIKSAKTLIQIWLLFCTCGWTGILICPCKALSTSRLNFKLKLEIKQQREGKVSQWNMCLTKVTSVWEVWKRN